MGEVVRFRKPTATEKAQGKTLCKRGFHKWKINKTNGFDSKQGKLVTQFRCSRCGVLRTSAR
jgi:hypothetical protein